MRCCFSQICSTALNAAATHSCSSGRVVCDECGILCDGGELRFLKDSEFIKHLEERFGIDESNSLHFFAIWIFQILIVIVQIICVGKLCVEICRVYLIYVC